MSTQLVLHIGNQIYTVISTLILKERYDIKLSSDVIEMKKYVQVTDLVKNYGDFCALNKLSFEVYEGEIFGLLGPNGAGKSTTLSIISSLLDYDKGIVLVEGKDIRKHKNSIRKNIGWIPQDITLYSHLNALENVCFFASLYGLKGKANKEAALEALEFVGLVDEMKKRPAQMSGGMKRRLNIACGIVHKPNLIIMDEPTVGVDAMSREQIMLSIKKLKMKGVTVIYTSHYMKEVEDLCDKIAIINRGEITAYGTLRELNDLYSLSKIWRIYSGSSDEDLDKLKLKVLSMPGIRSAKRDNGILSFETDISVTDISHIISEVVNSGIQISDISSEKMNLEKIFLSLTDEVER